MDIASPVATHAGHRLGGLSDASTQLSQSMPAMPAMPAELRQEQIANLVERVGFTRVTVLAEHFGVSSVTVRTDLAALESAGRLRRVRGGAVPGTAGVAETPIELAFNEQAGEKNSIATYAAGLVSSGDMVLLDVGSTTTAIADALMARRDLSELTVVTSSLNAALRLEAAGDRITVIVSGGTVRPLQHSLVNPFATLLLERLTAHIAFIGCNGVDARGGVTNRNVAEAEIKRAMVGASRRAIVVADGTKLGEIEVAKVCDLSQVDLLVTDASAEPDVLDELRRAGLPVHIAG